MESLSKVFRRHFVASRPDLGDSQPTEAVEEEAFQAHCQGRLDRSGRIGMMLCLFATLAWWPLDSLIYGKATNTPNHSEDFRLIICAVSALYVLLPRGPFFLRHAFWLLSGELAVIMASLSYTAGQLGGLEKPWFYLAYPFTSATIILPLPMRRRAVMISIQSLGWMAGLFLFRPENLASGYLPVTLSVLVLVAIASLALGHYLLLLQRDNFLKSLALSHNAAELESKVAEKTQTLRELLAHLERAREDERAHISRELHDELGQELTALRYTLAVTMERFAQEPALIEKNLSELDHMLGRASKTLRSLVGQMRPPILDDLGLKAATDWLVKNNVQRTGLIYKTTIVGDDSQMQKELVSAAFRILQESLTNVIRHASATHIEVTLTISDRQLELRVADDGVGFDPQSQKGGMGILGMRERALALGAQLVISSSPGAGSEVCCTLPISGPVTFQKP
jgi:signal transduction histidine kinase